MRKQKAVLFIVCLIFSGCLLNSCAKEKTSPEDSLTFASFESSKRDILIGKETWVTFTAAIESKHKIEQIAVEKENGEVIGYLNDNGKSGDEKAGDNLYSGRIKMISGEVSWEDLRAAVNNARSEAVRITFYRELTEADFEELNALNAQMAEIQLGYLDAEGYVKASELEALLSSVTSFAKDQYDKGLVKEYRPGPGSVYMELLNGIGYMFIPRQKDVLSSGPNKKIITAEPVKNDFAVTTSKGFSWLTKKFNRLEYQGGYGAQDNAEMLADINGDYDYQVKLENDYVTIANLKTTLFNSDVIIWEGHGGYDEKIGSALITSESATRAANLGKYSSDLASKRMVTTNSWLSMGTDFLFCDYAVTGEFFKEYLPNQSLEGCVVFLGACYSANDDRLANGFINKGAKVVYGSKGSINMEYEMLMRTTLFYNLTKQKESGDYYTAEEALTSAWDTISPYDASNEGTYVTYYGEGSFRMLGENDAEAEKEDSGSFAEYFQDEDVIRCGIYENNITKKWNEGSSYMDPNSKTIKWQEGYYSPQINPYTVEKGALSAKTADFDRDGTEEMLVIRVEAGADEQNEASDNLVASMYSLKYGVPVEMDRCVLAYNVSRGAANSEIDVFAKEMDGKIRIFCEDLIKGGFIYDGIEWHLRAVAYANGRFENKADLYLAGSSFMESEFLSLKSSLKQAGLTGPYIDTLNEDGGFYEEPLWQSESEIRLLSSIKMWFLYDRDEYEVFMNDSRAFLTSEEGGLKPIIVEINDYSDLSSHLNVPMLK